MALEDMEYELRGEFTEDSQWIHLQAHKMFQRTFKPWIGRELLVTVKVLRYKRSAAQNRYMWSCVVPTVKNWLYETQGEKHTKESVYTWLRVKLLGEQPVISNIEGMDVVTMVGKRFSAMNSKEFATAIDTIREKMAERGCDIPEPKKKGLNLIEDFIDD